jgi:uncharacterized protein YciI
MSAQLFVIEHSPGPAWVNGVPYREQPGIDTHLRFMQSLHARGILVLGGPFLDEPGGTHVGMAIVRASDVGDAEALAAEDASVVAGLIRVRVRPWLVPMGTALEGT